MRNVRHCYTVRRLVMPYRVHSLTVLKAARAFFFRHISSCWLSLSLSSLSIYLRASSSSFFSSSFVSHLPGRNNRTDVCSFVRVWIKIPMSSASFLNCINKGAPRSRLTFFPGIKVEFRALFITLHERERERKLWNTQQQQQQAATGELYVTRRPNSTWRTFITCTHAPHNLTSIF